MLKHNIKRAIMNKNMLISLLATFLCLLIGGYEPVFLYGKNVDFTYTFYYALSCGTISILPLAFPIISSLPYASSYSTEYNTGFFKYYLLKTQKKYYIISKIISCGISGGFAVAFPTLLFLLLCIALKGPEITGEFQDYIAHGLDFYLNAPFYYCLASVLNLFICGALFALIGLAVSVIIKNTYLVNILPFCFYIFMAMFFANININLNPVILFDINSYAESKFIYVIVYKLILLLSSIAVFTIGVYKNEE